MPISEDGRQRRQAVVYWRDDGPICYDIDLQDHEPGLPLELLTYRVEWWWESRRERPVAADSAMELPDRRELTQLTQESADLLRKDLAERDVDGYGRYLCILGIDTGERLTLSKAVAAALLDQFAGDEETPLWVVVVQIGDRNDTLVFVPKNPTDHVQHILSRWVISSNGVQRRPYRKLRPSLERIFWS